MISFFNLLRGYEHIHSKNNRSLFKKTVPQTYGKELKKKSKKKLSGESIGMIETCTTIPISIRVSNLMMSADLNSSTYALE